LTSNHRSAQCSGQFRISYPGAWDAFNKTISGRLVGVVPSAKYCASLPGGCTDAQWVAHFSVTIPGATDQGYDLKPPSLCLRNSTTTTCGQGDVPLYSVEAETAADIQAAVKFSSAHICALKAAGKIAVGGAAATVANAGGYVQGAGHSALSPTFGLGRTMLLFRIVIASGELLQVNSISHPDLFYALRGGGAGSWGIIVSATFRTFPTFNATSSLIILAAANHTILSSITTLHAQHIFDWDSVRAGQYFWAVTNGTGSDAFPHTTPEQSLALLSPFLNASLALPGVFLLSQNFTYGDINDALFQPDDGVGFNTVLGSRLIPAATYRHSPGAVGKAYEKLLAGGATQILGHLVAGVAENVNISSAVHPAWRTAKHTLLVVSSSWDDSASLAEIREIRNFFQTTQVPILEEITGPRTAAYSNEADSLEPNFQTTFFGPNYAKLSSIKKKYDPNDLFIVGAGVGSERWDEWGLCQV
ncbi:FAD-binding domain-containing protein, partial [Mycena leptocephala]